MEPNQYVDNLTIVSQIPITQISMSAMNQ